MLTQYPDAMLILLVEDDDNHIELIKRSFELVQEEYRLEIVCTICDAQVFIAGRIPQLILTDYKLPDGDGKELISLMNGGCPVILMTSHGNEQVAVAALKAGAQDYIVKSPETFSTLPRVVALAMREWDLAQKSKIIYEAVSRGKREWEQTFDAVPDMISIIDKNHTILRVNRAMAERCGAKPEELIGRACYEVMHNMVEPPSYCPHSLLMQDGRNHLGEVEEKKLNGFFDITVSPLLDSDGRITASVHVARDVTERKKAEEERRKMEQKYQQTQKLESLGVLAGGIAHDFNNILTIILGHCHIINNGINSGIDQKNHVTQIEKAAGRAADLCRQMLTYAGKNALVETRINIWLLVDENVKMLHSALQKSVAIKLGLKNDIPEIMGDSAQIQQVVMNLIINAAEAIGDKNGTVEIELKKVTIQADQEKDSLGNFIYPGTYACLEVSDDGCGMDAETQKRIFEPFYTTKFTGRGLGMSAVLGIIKSHDGVLQLTSAPGAGTCFKVYFPLSGLPEIIETVPATALVSSTKAAFGTVLLVDDEESLRVVGSELLNAMGFSAMTATNGREALEVYGEMGSRIDLILLDLLMPEMGGIDAYLRLRKISSTIPIVICNGYAVGDILESMEDDENVAVIQKPYNPNQLRDTLMKLLAKTQ